MDKINLKDNWHMQEALEEFFNAPETLIPFCILGVLGCVLMIIYVVRNMRL